MSITIKEVYVISNSEKENESSRWTKVGVAFVNKDSSLNVILDVLPLNGRLHIRDRKSKKESE